MRSEAVASVLRHIVFSVLLVISPVSSADETKDEFYSQKMMSNLDAASRWLIEEGILTYTKLGKAGLHRKLVGEWGVLLWVDPWIESEHYLAQFRIKARGINYDIHNLHRKQVGNRYFEFWVSKIVAKDWSGEETRSVFYVVETDDRFGARTIVLKSDQFIEEYQVEGEKRISLPTGDLNLLYKLEAWAFPQNYRNSELKDKDVIMDHHGNLRLR